MAQQIINNGESGATVRGKINDNFTELYSLFNITNSYTDIADLLLDQGDQLNNGLYFVTDASDDTTVDSGWAIYKYNGTIVGDLTDYIKITEEESLDINLTNYVPTSRTVNGLALSSNISVPGISPVFRSGEYFSNAITSENATTIALSANTLQAFLWRIDHPVSFDRVKLEVTTGVASTTCRVAIYSDSNGYPNALVANSDTGTFDTSSITTVENTPSSNISLTPGYYHIVINSNGAATLRAHFRYAIAGISEPSAMGTGIGGATTTRWGVSYTYAAMPSTFPASATRSSVVCPKIIFRAV